MARCRPFVVSLLACPLLVLAGSAIPRAAPSSQFDQPAPAAATADPRAVELLDRAVARLDPERVQWQEATVWQRTACADLRYQAEGRFLAAPGNRRRLNLRVKVGQARGELRVVADGRRLRVAGQVGERAPAVWEAELPGQPDACAEVLRQQGVGGAGALLAVIRRGLQRPQREVVRWGGGEVYRITGEWPGDRPPTGTPTEDGQGSAVPCRCRLYLDVRTLWPRRVEWWAEESGGGAALVSEVEFRDPVLNRPLPPERCPREFALGPT
jgi:hypothetical protein